MIDNVDMFTFVFLQNWAKKFVGQPFGANNQCTLDIVLNIKQEHNLDKTVDLMGFVYEQMYILDDWLDKVLVTQPQMCGLGVMNISYISDERNKWYMIDDKETRTGQIDMEHGVGVCGDKVIHFDNPVNSFGIIYAIGLWCNTALDMSVSYSKSKYKQITDTLILLTNIIDLYATLPFEQWWGVDHVLYHMLDDIKPNELEDIVSGLNS